MLATAVTLAVIGFAVRALAELARNDGTKIIAAFQGRSWAAKPRPDRPIVVRLSSNKAEAPAWPELRAAA
jgi:hypothetical protein